MDDIEHDRASFSEEQMRAHKKAKTDASSVTSSESLDTGMDNDRLQRMSEAFKTIIEVSWSVSQIECGVV